MFPSPSLPILPLGALGALPTSVWDVLLSLKVPSCIFCSQPDSCLTGLSVSPKALGRQRLFVIIASLILS